MPFSPTESRYLATIDPTGAKVKELANAIVSLPAYMRAVASMRSALVQELNSGGDKEQIAYAWRRVNEFAAKVTDIHKIVEWAWNRGIERGDFRGAMPTVVIVTPDRPSGLGDYVTVAALTFGGALIAAGLLAILFTTWPVWVAGAFVVAGALLAGLGIARDAVVVVVQSPHAKEIVAAVGQTASAASNIGIAVAFIAALWFLAPRRKA